MNLFERIGFKTKIAFVCLVCGKLMSIPTAYFLFSGKTISSIIAITSYFSLVLVSLVLSYLDLSNIKKGRNEVINHFKSVNTDKDATYIVKVVNGKMVIVQ